jgi:hypothetical protein
MIIYVFSGFNGGYNTYRGWTEIEYQNRHCIIDRKDEESWDDSERDGQQTSPSGLRNRQHA